jgi:diguanylate cyclase (GGDEF)-like protein
MERERQLEAALEEATAQRERAEAQSLVLESITVGASLRETLELLVNTIEARSDGMLGSVLLLDAEGKTLTHGAAPSLPASYTDAIDGLAIGPAVGSCGTAAYDGRQVVVEDIAKDRLWVDFRELAAEAGLAACWSTPIRSVAGRVLGTFALYYHEPRGPTEDELTLIEEAVRLASISIERGRALARNAHDALHDPLTGLANRALLDDRLEHALASSRRTNERIAVLFIDLDGFKEINDKDGHEAGDRALRAAARRILAAVRPSDTVARWGGDEFVLVRENVSGPDDVQELVERIQTALRERAADDREERDFAASIGVALSGEGPDTPASLLQAADRAMYRAKAAAG